MFIIFAAVLLLCDILFQDFQFVYDPDPNVRAFSHVFSSSWVYGYLCGWGVRMCTLEGSFGLVGLVGWRRGFCADVCPCACFASLLFVSVSASFSSACLLTHVNTSIKQLSKHATELAAKDGPPILKVKQG